MISFPLIRDTLRLMDKIFIFLQYIVPQHLLSRCTGWLAELKHPVWLKNRVIGLFIRHFDVDMSEALEPDHERYSFEQMHDRLYAKGFTIYPGKGAREATFRLAFSHYLDGDTDQAIEVAQQGMWREVAHEAADLGFTVYAVDTSGVRVSPRGDVDVGPADTFESIPLEGEIDPSGGGGPAQAAGAVPVDPDVFTRATCW